MVATVAAGCSAVLCDAERIIAIAAAIISIVWSELSSSLSEAAIVAWRRIRRSGKGKAVLAAAHGSIEILHAGVVAWRLIWTSLWMFDIWLLGFILLILLAALFTPPKWI